MKRTERELATPITKTLKERMVFVGGPRQVGKTTLALSILGTKTQNHPAYLNWDTPGVSRRIRNNELPLQEPLLVFDEVHKYRHWRNLLKGLYDTYKDEIQFLVTGSARLDHYRRGGDSLFGRYRYFRLHPFSVRELGFKTRKDIEPLLRFGGFPEPLFKSQEAFHRLWKRERLMRLVREDLRDLEHVREVGLIEQLAEELPRRVGSPLSVASLREDLLVDHKTVSHWLSILENLYYCFRIAPYGPPKIRAIKKEPKLYLWDWSAVPSEGPRFENLVASQLLKYCHHIEDTEGYKMELRYLRDVHQKEIDFVVLRDGSPQFAVEAKLSDEQPTAAVAYFQERTRIPQFYQVHLSDRAYRKGKLAVLPFTTFCEKLKMP